MYEVKLELFEEALKMKMLVDATDVLKSTYYIINDSIFYRHISSEEGEQLKNRLNKHLEIIY